jgi:hypothetical protein
MSRDLSESASMFAARYGLRLRETLGSGIHGSVHLVQDNTKGGATALKVHHSEEFYRREVAVYLRLREAGVRQVLGFAVPQLVRTDEDLLALEMTVVEKPYLLDFAGAYLDVPPEFSDEVWADWEAEKRETFGERWPQVQEVLGALESYGIHLLDINPGNLAFCD